MDKKMSLKDVEYCVNPQKRCRDCKYCEEAEEDEDCRFEALTIAAKIIEEKIEEKNKKMIDKAIDKIGISRDLIDMDNCYYPISKIKYPNGVEHEFDEEAVCIMVDSYKAAILIFGLEDEEDDDKEMPQV